MKDYDKAFKIYVSTDLSLKEIAGLTGLSYSYLQNLSSKGNWRTRKLEMKEKVQMPDNSSETIRNALVEFGTDLFQFIVERSNSLEEAERVGQKVVDLMFALTAYQDQLRKEQPKKILKALKGNSK